MPVFTETIKPKRNGKGDRACHIDKQKFDENYERAFGKSHTPIGGRKKLIYDKKGNPHWVNVDEVRRAVRQVGPSSGISVHGGVLPHQADELRKAVAVAGIDGITVRDDGNVEWVGRENRLKFLRLRGLHDNYEIRGGS